LPRPCNEPLADRFAPIRVKEELNPERYAAMGLLIDGVWHDQGYDTKKTGGRFERSETSFRNWVTADGAAGSTGSGGFKAAAGRYHLYVSLACPWAHRTLIFRKLKRLEDIISVSIVHPLMLEEGWTFGGYPGAIPDTVLGTSRLYEVYLAARKDFTGRVTVPVLWDKERNTIVSNESADIIRMFNSAFDALTGAHNDYYPVELQSEIDDVNARVYRDINNGVYRAGFATTQEAYEEAYTALFTALDEMEARLARRQWLAGERITEADIRLFTTLVRFDAVYHGHFKCNRRTIAAYPQLSNYARALFQIPEIGSTVNFDHIKTHYYASHRQINPSGIVPLGPADDWQAPHDRGRFGSSA
jgi:putative glutathione S-transferase